ncbi:hypothetical protein BvCmsNSNP029_00078 [Escherichia coli]|nr:hypothetical protein BvCmsNSNP029_00078 [Escherichia coli]
MLLGQWLATAEVAEVVIAPIVFSFIKPLCHILIMIGHTITVVWIVPPCHILISKMLTGDTVEIVDVDIDVVAVVLPAITVTMTAIVVMIIIIVMMMMVMIVVIPVDAAE